jgi:hypothetical protein
MLQNRDKWQAVVNKAWELFHYMRGTFWLSEVLWTPGEWLAPWQSLLLTGYGRQLYNHPILFFLSRFKDYENRSFSTDSSKSRFWLGLSSHLYRGNDLATGRCCIWQAFWCIELCAYIQTSCIQPRIAPAGAYISKITLQRLSRFHPRAQAAFNKKKKKVLISDLAWTPEHSLRLYFTLNLRTEIGKCSTI